MIATQHVLVSSCSVIQDFLNSVEAEMRDVFESDSSVVHVLLQPSR